MDKLGGIDMRAVKTKHGITLITKEQADLLSIIDEMGAYPISNLNERQHELCNEMYKMNILRKAKKGDVIVYKSYKEQV